MNKNAPKKIADYGWKDETPRPTHAYLAEPIRDILVKINARKVLDLGCGNGVLSHWLQACGFDVTGCDVDCGGLAIAANGKSGAKFKEVGVYDPPEKLIEKDFDVVVATEVVEHLFLPSALARFARAIVKSEEGYLIVTTPYHGYFKNLLIAITGKWDRHHTALWEGGHIKFWSRRTLSALLEENGFEVVDFKGVGRFFGFWKSMILVARLRKD